MSDNKERCSGMLRVTRSIINQDDIPIKSDGESGFGGALQYLFLHR